MLREMYNRDSKILSEVLDERDKLRKENIELYRLRKETVELQQLREDNHKLLKENYNLYKDLDNFRNKINK
jgi:mevalonate kinase